jgi:hypothetical protein
MTNNEYKTKLHKELSMQENFNNYLQIYFGNEKCQRQ